MYEASERLGAWPHQIDLITLPAIQKPTGGHRLVGIFAGAYRVWSKARRDLANEWERLHDRDYFASGADRSTADAVWLQAAAAEAEVAAQGTAAAAVLTDLEKFFEYVDHQLLYDRAVRAGLPAPLVRLTLAAYSGPRMIRMKDFIAQEIHADKGIIAGCSLATTFVKAYVIEAYDDFVQQVPGVRFDSYIDDNVISMEGKELHVEKLITRAANIMADIVRERLMCRIAKRKTHVVATKEDLGRRILEQVRGRVGGEQQVTAPSLGIDYTAGIPRKKWRAKSTAAVRLKQGEERRTRLARLSNLMGSRGAAIFATGVLPAITYGAEVRGSMRL